jgi:hypothetical protein
VRTTVEGPKLRWVSRIEEIKVPIPPPPIMQHTTTGASSLASTSYWSVYGPPGTLFTPTTYTYASGSLVKTSITPASTTLPHAQANTPNLTVPQYSPYQYQISPFPIWPPNHQQPYYPTSSTPAAPSTDQGYQPSPAVTSLTPAVSLPTQLNQSLSDQQPASSTEPAYKTETVTKNYLVHELAQHRGAPRPTWADNMKAMFGDHVKWDELKVFVGKNRPHCKWHHV